MTFGVTEFGYGFGLVLFAFSLGMACNFLMKTLFSLKRLM